MGDFRQSYSTAIVGTLDGCFAVLSDFAAYPEWSGPVQECEVLDRYPDGLPRRVAFALDFTLKTIRYVLEYTWDKPRGARWHLVEGDVKDVQGSYECRQQGGRAGARPRAPRRSTWASGSPDRCGARSRPRPCAIRSRSSAPPSRPARRAPERTRQPTAASGFGTDQR